MFLSAVKMQLCIVRILSRLKLNCHEKIEESFFSKAFLKLLRITLQIFGWLQLKTIIIFSFKNLLRNSEPKVACSTQIRTII
jgi:hypothetical protein